MECTFMENDLTDIDKVWDLFVAYKQKVRVVVQVSPAVRVAIGEAFGLSRGEDALPKLATALKTLGADMVVDGAIAYDVLAYDLAQEVKARIASGGALPLVYCRGGKSAAAWQEDASMAAYTASVRPPMQALSVAIKRAFLGDGKRTFVVAVMPCPCGKKIAENKGRRKGDLPATDVVLTTDEVIEMLLSAGMDLKYLPAGEIDEPFGASSGVGQVFAVTGGIAEGVMRYLADDVSMEALRRIEYSGVRTKKGYREAEIEGKIVAVAASGTDIQAVKNAILAGECGAVFVEVSGNVDGCIVGKSQATDDETTKKLRAYGLYQIDKRMARIGGENVRALSVSFAADVLDDAFEEMEVVLSPFAEEEIVEEPAPVIEEEIVEEPVPVIEEEIVEEPAPAIEEEIVEEPAPAIEEEIVEEVEGEDEEADEEIYEEITEEEYAAMSEEERMKTFDPNYRRMSRTQRRKMKRSRKGQK